jgi:hypothetical protein
MRYLPQGFPNCLRSSDETREPTCFLVYRTGCARRLRKGYSERLKGPTKKRRNSLSDPQNYLISAQMAAIYRFRVASSNVC